MIGLSVISLKGLKFYRNHLKPQRRELKILSQKDFKPMLWKNGAGHTTELIRLDHPTDPDMFSLRISIADVTTSGPFSVFKRIDRILFMLEGDGMVLEFEDDTKIRLDRPFNPIYFPGEAEVHSKLIGGPNKDLNVMYDRTVGEAKVDFILSKGIVEVGGMGQHFCFNWKNSLSVKEQVLPEQTLIVLDSGEKLQVKLPSDSILIVVTFTT